MPKHEIKVTLSVDGQPKWALLSVFDEKATKRQLTSVLLEAAEELPKLAYNRGDVDA